MRSTGCAIVTCDVTVPLLYPVRACPGQVVVAMPGTAHPPYVTARGSARVIRIGVADDAAVARLISDGVLVPRPSPLVRAARQTG